MFTSIALIVIAAASMWIGFCYGRWHEQEQRKKAMGEATRLMGHMVNLFPQDNEAMDAFRQRIVATLNGS
ncbi:unnamed protein product [marine sediment metagenome]|uniref:Uncharacterized protein n=1 Tax=marine sediment metagenome TaxID=412755 RepID=X0Y9A7_9ZZZZ